MCESSFPSFSLSCSDFCPRNQLHLEHTTPHSAVHTPADRTAVTCGRETSPGPPPAHCRALHVPDVGRGPVFPKQDEQPPSPSPSIRTLGLVAWRAVPPRLGGPAALGDPLQSPCCAQTRAHCLKAAPERCLWSAVHFQMDPWRPCILCVARQLVGHLSGRLPSSPRFSAAETQRSKESLS